jgi:hypothetical protein
VTPAASRAGDRFTAAGVARIARGAEAAALGLGLALAVATLGAPGWGPAADLALAAHGLDGGVAPGQPAYALLGKLATLVPVGDIGWRIAALSVIAVVAALAGVIALARALVPDERLAGPIAAAVAATAPAVLGAATVAGTGGVLAALAVWAVALAVRARRGAPTAVGALALAAAATAIHPLAGGGLLGVVAAAVVRGRGRALAAAALLAAVAPLWWLVVVRAGPAGPDLSARLASLLTLEDAGARLGAILAGLGAGSGAALLLAGLVGLGLGATTGLRGAALPLAAAAALVAAAALSPSGELTAAALLLLAAGLAPLAGAAARILARDPTPGGRLAIGGAAAAPVALLALLGPGHAAPIDPGGDVPARAARAVTGGLPAGPGVLILDAPALWSAARFERIVAGERPDLAIVARDADADRLAAIQLQAGRPAGSDVAGVGRLDPRHAIPRGRAFQILAGPPPAPPPAPPAPAGWPGATGAALAEDLALARARYEAMIGRLDEAARAAGLAGERFDAAELALLAAAVPSPARPAVHGFIPPLGGGRAVARDLLADDLAWVAGLDAAPLPPRAPPERRLHALWRDLLAGQRDADDPDLAALGPAAAQATAEMLTATGRR